jgi:hypothetical protein
MSAVSKARTLVVLATVVGLLVAPLANDATACPNVTRLEVDRDVKDVARAEKNLGNDDFAKARADLKRMRRWETFIEHSTRLANAYFSHGGNINGRKDPNEDFIPVALRAYRLLALIAVRDPTATAQEKTIARETMLDFVKNSNDPTMAIDAAEVFSHSADLAPVALMMLRSYADKDLIGSAWAYAALARLEQAQGNAAAASSARERCLRMAKHESTCAAAP